MNIHNQSTGVITLVVLCVGLVVLVGAVLLLTPIDPSLIR